jgi:uncharacterized membrane protein
MLPILAHALLLSTGGRDAFAPGIAPGFAAWFAAVGAVPHTLCYLALLATFAASLRPGREAVISALSRRLRGPLPARVAAYTRAVTAAWCLFFAAQLGLSLGLFVFAPFAAWSLFVNVLNLPLVALMFAGEYAWRLRHLPDAPRHRLADLAPLLGHFRALVARR